MKIGIVGAGVLGRACARGVMEHADVLVYDIMPERRTHELAEVAQADIVMICLPTPANADGTCDTSAIDKFLAEAYIGTWWTPESCYVIRSTVPVGYTAKMFDHYNHRPLLHSPEFLTARCALTDFQIPARNIIGRPALPPVQSTDSVDVARIASNLSAVLVLQLLYKTRFPGVPIHVMSSNESELVKLACNAFFATKVTFFNTIHLTAKEHGCDWNAVRAGILSDGRIAHAHTMVPGPSGELGYGGACLSKDTASLRHAMKAPCHQLLMAVERTNAEIRGELNERLVPVTKMNEYGTGTPIKQVPFISDPAKKIIAEAVERIIQNADAEFVNEHCVTGDPGFKAFDEIRMPPVQEIVEEANRRNYANAKDRTVPASESSVERTMRNVDEARRIVSEAAKQRAVEEMKAVDKSITDMPVGGGTVLPKDVAADFERVKDMPIIYGQPVAIRRIDCKPDETLRLKAQVIRMAHIAIKALGQGVRPALAAGLKAVIDEAGFEEVEGYGEDERGYAMARVKIEAALQEANRAVANKAVSTECGTHQGQLRTEDGLPIWYHPSTNGETRACEDDGWMDVNGWKPLTEEVAKVHRK